MAKDSLTWTGLRPEWNDGATEKSFKCKLRGDSLRISFDPEYNPVYINSHAKTFQEYFLAKGGLKIKLPKAVNVKRSSTKGFGYEELNIRIGFKEGVVKIFVGDNETRINDLDSAIRKFRKSSEEGYDTLFFLPEIRCQLFMDEDVPCDFTFRVFESLRINDIRSISFVTEADEYDPNTPNFYGLRLYLPKVAQ